MGLTLYTGSSLLAFLACAIFSPFVILSGRKNRQTYLFSGLTLLAGIWCLFPFITAQADSESGAIFAARLVYSFALFVPPVFLHLTFSLLDLPKTNWDRLLLRCSYIISILFVFLLPTDLLIAGVIRFAPFFGVVPGFFYTVFVVFFGATCAIGFVRLLQGYRNATGVKKNQLRYIFVSWFLAYIAGLLHFMPAYFRFEPFPHDFLVVAFVPLSAYAIIRYRLLDIKLAFTRTTIFALVYAFVLGLPFLVGYTGQEFLARYFGKIWWLIPVTIGALFATLGPFIYLALRRKAEDRLLVEQRRYQETLRRASSDMTRIRSLSTLLKLIVHILTRTMRVSHATLYLFDPEKKQYVPVESRGSGKPLPGIAVGLDDPIIRYLRASRDAIVGEEVLLQRQQQAASMGLRELADQLRRLNADCVIPSFIHDHLLGLVVMGAKLSGRMYTDDDLKVLLTLANQAALAIENARFYEAEKERQAALFHSAQLASLGTMAGSMGHQINNRFHVLAVLAGTMKAVLNRLKPSAAETEQLEKLQARLLETFAKIEDNAVRGGDIVKTLLNFSKPGKVERISFPEIINMATELAQHRVKFDEIDFEPVLSNPLPPINGNKNQLTEAFYNLISNGYDAIKSKEEAIEEGRLTLLTGQTYKGKIAISVTSTVKNGATLIQAVVHDNGNGIKAEDLSHLFVPFFTTKATSQKGTGLGLYVIKGIVENHGGKIDVSSVYGEGTTFTLQLPVAGEKF